MTLFIPNVLKSFEKDFFEITENISYHVAAGRINKDLLHDIMSAIMENTYDSNEELKLRIYNSINEEVK